MKIDTTYLYKTKDFREHFVGGATISVRGIEESCRIVGAAD